LIALTRGKSQRPRDHLMYDGMRIYLFIKH